MSSSAGRPRKASRELLQEAAFELFQMRGYARTSVEQIARTAGFSRATFFNFFSSKAELFWVETDALIAGLREHLDGTVSRPHPPSLREALLGYAETVGSSDIPWALQNHRLLEADHDLIASGAGRVLEVNRLLQRYREGAERTPASAAENAAEAAAHTALLLSAVLAWIDAGVSRGALRLHLERAYRTLSPEPLS